MQSETEQSSNETLGTRSEVEVLAGCKRRVKATVPAEKVREELDKNYRQLTQSVQIPGFRKGRVPRKLLEARYGEEIEGDVKDALLNVSLAEVLEEKDLKVIGSPRFDNVQFHRDSDLSYEVELEVRPEFEVAAVTGVDLRPQPEPVTDEKVEERIEAVRRSQARYTPIDASQAGPEDLHTGKYQLYRDGEKVKSSESVSFSPSKKVVDGFFVEDLPERCASWDRTAPLVLDGMKVPESYDDEVLRGAPVRLEFVLDDVRRLELPDPEGLAKELGLSSPEEVRKSIREDLEKESLRAAETLADQKILDTLLEATSMDLPEGLLENQKTRWRLEREYKLLEEKVPKEEVDSRLEKEGETAAEDLKRGLKTFFIFEKIAEDERIFVTEREVDQRVARFAALYGLPFDAVREELKKTGRIDEIRTMIRHEKVRAYLRKKALPPAEPAKGAGNDLRSQGERGESSSAPAEPAPESSGEPVKEEPAADRG